MQMRQPTPNPMAAQMLGSTSGPLPPRPPKAKGGKKASGKKKRAAKKAPPGKSAMAAGKKAHGGKKPGNMRQMMRAERAEGEY